MGFIWKTYFKEYTQTIYSKSVFLVENRYEKYVINLGMYVTEVKE